MAKCTGSRCPMQVGYKVDECDYKDCPYRTEPITNAQKIRAMSDEELAKLLECFGLCHYCSEHNRLGDMRIYADEKCDEKCVDHCLEWLKHPAD